MGQVIAMHTTTSARAKYVFIAVNAAARRRGASALIALNAAGFAEKLVRNGHSAAWSISVGKSLARQNTQGSRA
jgi:hypothetical protein